jgi:hypothetical protein
MVDKDMIFKTMRSIVLLWLLGITLRTELVAQSVLDKPASAQVTVEGTEEEAVEVLLRQLDEAYIQYLETSKIESEIRKAESLLQETNDNTTWTNFKAASKLLREQRDKAAVPLLLKYILLHSERSSRNVIIPEYLRTVEQLTGKQLPMKYQPGPDLREHLAGQISLWWNENKDSFNVDPQEMDDEALGFYIRNRLLEIREIGEFTRSKAERETCYATCQTVHYGVLKKSEAMIPLHGGNLPQQLRLLLEACDDQPVFPYEAVWLLSELCKAGLASNVLEVASDANRDKAVRLVCWLALYRAGNAYPSKEMLELYQQEVDFERRLILLASMRWGSPIVAPTLVSALEDENFEIASAAATSVVSFQVAEALPRIEKLLSVERESPLLVYNALAEMKSFESKLLLKKLLVEALQGGANRVHLGRLLDAFESAWGVTRNSHLRSSTDTIVRARTGLQFAEVAIQKRNEELLKLAASLESLSEQLKIAEKVIELRKSEYRRLSGLLGDEIVTAEIVQEAKAHLELSRTEAEGYQQKIVDTKARIEQIKR